MIMGPFGTEPFDAPKLWGFTGTRHGLTDAQLAWLYQQLEDGRPNQVHHGACMGADIAVHEAALDITEAIIHVWPPVNLKWCATQCLYPHPRVIVHPRMPYLNRDREIVKAAAILKALPRQEEQPPANLWGGTWYTVDFAERTRVPVDICYPSGRIEKRRETR